MLPEIPAYLESFEMITRPILPIIILGLIWIGVSRINGSAFSRYLTGGVMSVVLIAWLVVAEYLGSANTYYATADNAFPTVVLGLMIPLIVAGLAFTFTNSIRKFLSAVPLPLLVAAQLFRLEGGIFLVLWADGRLPWQFALPAGIGDVATAFYAPFVARQLALQTASAKRTAYLWSIFGIADLVIALIMGAMTSPGRVHFFGLAVPNLYATAYPLVMVPTFAVPLALMLHGIVLWRLRQENPLRAVNQTVLSSH